MIVFVAHMLPADEASERLLAVLNSVTIEPDLKREILCRFCTVVGASLPSLLAKEKREFFVKLKNLFTLFGLLLLLATASLAQTVHVVTMTYSNGTVVVSPAETKAAIGDVIVVGALPRGAEFVLTFPNALTGGGPTVKSKNGTYTWTVQAFGYFGCSMLINGQLVSAGYGGEVVPDSAGR